MFEDKYWPKETDSFLELKKGNSVELVFLTEISILLEKVGFGLHKNRNFEEVMEEDPLDMVWMYTM